MKYNIKQNNILINEISAIIKYTNRPGAVIANLIEKAIHNKPYNEQKDILIELQANLDDIIQRIYTQYH